MKEGFKGNAPVVTARDIEQAQEILRTAVDNRAADRLRAKIPSSYFLVPDALSENVSILTSEVEAGDRVESFDGTAVATASAVIFRKEDIDTAVEYYFENEYGKIDGVQLLPERDIIYTFAEKNFDTEDFSLDLRVQQQLGTTIDIIKLRDAILGKREGEVRTYIANYPGLKKAQVKFWPFWVHSVPANKDRVFITIQYSQNP